MRLMSYSDSCRHYNLFRQTLLIAQQAIVCSMLNLTPLISSANQPQVLLTLRTYALYRRSLRVLRFLLGSGVVLAGVGLVCLRLELSTGDI
jgi:hypothetical protein